MRKGNASMLKLAICGLGRWGSRLIESVQGTSDHLRFVAGVTRDPARHRPLAAASGIALVESYAEVLRDPQVDAVVLATPHSHHSAQVVEAAEAGKHVYVEKPMALTRETAQRAVDACRSAGVTLGIGFSRRYLPVFGEMMRRIRSGAIGDVLHVEAQHSGPGGHRARAGDWRATRAEAPAGGMTARGIHALDAMIHIAGPATSVYAHSDRRRIAVDMDDVTSVALKFATGITGYLGTVFMTAEFWRVHVFGSKGWLEMRGSGELYVSGLEGKPERLQFPAVSKEKAVLEAFADAVKRKRPFLVPATEAVNGIAVLEAIVASAARNEPVSIAP